MSHSRLAGYSTFTVSPHHNLWIICILPASLNHWHVRVKIVMESHIFRLCERVEIITTNNRVGCWGPKFNSLAWEEITFSVSIRISFKCFCWWQYNNASIIYHLKASTRTHHQSCLLLVNSSDFLIPKVWLMDNSLYLWVKYNQYLESFMFRCTVWETTEWVQKGIWGLLNGGRNWQSNTDDWQVGAHTLHRGKDSS